MDELRILWLEDSAFLVQAVLRSLRFWAPTWKVDVVASAANARVAILDGNYDVVLLDLVFDGSVDQVLDVCRDVRRAGSTVPLVALTAWEGQDVVMAALHAGMTDFISKSGLTVSALCERIRLVAYFARRDEAD